jgi:hypothetical protein
MAGGIFLAPIGLLFGLAVYLGYGRQFTTLGLSDKPAAAC